MPSPRRCSSSRGRTTTSCRRRSRRPSPAACGRRVVRSSSTSTRASGTGGGGRRPWSTSCSARRPSSAATCYGWRGERARGRANQDSGAPRSWRHHPQDGAVMSESEGDGGPTLVTCPRCGAQYLATATTCVDCGARLRAEADGGEEVAYDLADWTAEQREELVGALAAEGV